LETDVKLTLLLRRAEANGPGSLCGRFGEFGSKTNVKVLNIAGLNAMAEAVITGGGMAVTSALLWRDSIAGLDVISHNAAKTHATQAALKNTLGERNQAGLR
jgi:hypothetical protein